MGCPSQLIVWICSLFTIILILYIYIYIYMYICVCVCVCVCVWKVFGLKLYVPKPNWLINEIVPLALNTLFKKCYSYLQNFPFSWIFGLRKTKNSNKSTCGEYAGRCTCTIPCFAKIIDKKYQELALTCQESTLLYQIKDIQSQYFYISYIS